MRDLVTTGCEPRESGQGGPSSEHDAWGELVRLIGRNELRNNVSPVRLAQKHMAAQHPSAGFAPASALSGQGPETHAPGHDGSRVPRRQEPRYPYGDPLRDLGTSGRASRPQQPSKIEAQTRSLAAGHADVRAAYDVGREHQLDPDAGSYVSDQADEDLFVPQAREPRRASLAVAALTGLVLMGTAGAFGYYALSVSNRSGQARVIDDNFTRAKAMSADQNGQGEKLNENAVDTLPGEEQKIRGAANVPAPASSTDPQSQVNASSAPDAGPNASLPKKVRTITIRPEFSGPNGAVETIEATTLAAPASTDSQPQVNTSSTPRAGPKGSEPKEVRATAMRPDIANPNGAVECQASAGQGRHWAWRMIDGKKCWYEGKPGMSKGNLRWVRGAASR